MLAKRMTFHFSAILVCLCLLTLSAPAFAQGGAAPITIGQNAIGTLTADAGTAQYALTTAGGETATIQVLALSAGFTPAFKVLNPAGIEILNVPNPNGLATLSGNATFDSAGVYTIIILGENGSSGQFALSLQPGAPLPEPVTLTLNQPISATVGAQTPTQVYRFDTSSLGAVGVSVSSQTVGAGVLVTLYDQSANKTLASIDAGVVGVAFQLPALGHLYRIEIHAGAAGDSAYTICLGTCGSSSFAGGGTVNPSPTPNIIAPASTPEAAQGCAATSSAGGAVNLRSGPGIQYAIQGSLPLGQLAQILGQNTSNGVWYEVSFNGNIFWLSAAVVSLSGDCSALPSVAAPINAPLAPTATPTPTPLPPTSTPTETPESLPDLAVMGMTITQDLPTHARVTFDVYNNGTVDVTQPFYVYACITVLCVEKQVTLPVRAGSRTEVFVDFDHPSSNTPETVAVAVDSRGEIRELSEDNNTTSLSDVSLSF